MTEKVRMTRDIHNFVRGKMDCEDTIDLLGRVSESEKWIDYLLIVMELYEYSEICENYGISSAKLEEKSCNFQ